MLDDAGRMVGSTLLLAAENVEAVREIVERDQYFRGNVVSGRLCLARCTDVLC